MIKRLAQTFACCGIGVCIFCTLLSHRILRLEMFNQVTIMAALVYIRSALVITICGAVLFIFNAIYKSRKNNVSLIDYLFKIDIEMTEEDENE